MDISFFFTNPNSDLKKKGMILASSAVGVLIIDTVNNEITYKTTEKSVKTFGGFDKLSAPEQQAMRHKEFDHRIAHTPIRRFYSETYQAIQKGVSVFYGGSKRD